MRQRHGLILTGALLGLYACGAPPGGTDTQSIGAAASYTSSSGGADSPSTHGESSTSGQVTGTTGDKCVVDSDCPDLLGCFAGTCDDPCDYPPEEGGRLCTCEGSEAIIELPEPQVVLVVDKSGSTALSTFDDDGAPQTPAGTRWAGIHERLSAFLLTYDRSLNLGLALFPGLEATAQYDGSACVVAAAPEVSVTQNAATLILDVLPQAPAKDPELAGATPTHAAIESARVHLESLSGDRPQALVLITDGAANCTPGVDDTVALFEVYDDGLVGAVEGAYAAGVPTFVIGVDVPAGKSPTEVDGVPDGVDLQAALAEVALAGGVPTDDPEVYYDAVDGPSLGAALDDIAARLLPCEIPSEWFPSDLPVLVRIGGQLYDELPACDVGDGWTLSADDAVMTFCGQACADLREAGEIHLTIDPGDC